MPVITVIPARMASTRLPGKPLLEIAGKPMILHVLDRAREAALGPVLVACGDLEIVDAVRGAGAAAVLTKPDLASGSDRVYQALLAAPQAGDAEIVVNLQGDLPMLSAADLRACVALLDDPAVDIATLAAPVRSAEEATDPHVVKAVAEGAAHPGETGRALYFSRQPVPAGPGPLLHHIGVYAYRRKALERFVTAPPAVLEQREKLEQLRALALGMHIALAVVDSVPLGVDTEDDLRTARRLMAGQDQDR